MKINTKYEKVTNDECLFNRSSSDAETAEVQDYSIIFQMDHDNKLKQMTVKQ